MNEVGNQRLLCLHVSRRLTGSILIITSLLLSFFPTVRSQIQNPPQLTDSESKEAQQLSSTFMKRLGETLDFEIVMNELFLPDAVERFLAAEKRKAAQDKQPYVFLGPGMFIDTNTLDTASVSDWRRLHVATANFLLLGFVRMVRSGDLQTSPASFYPQPVANLVNRNPLLRNFIQKKNITRPLKSGDEMRSAAATLEQANTTLRKDVPPTPNLEQLVIRTAMRAASKQGAFTEQDFARVRSKMISVEIADREMLGFPKGTRLIMAMTLSAQVLLLVRSGDALKIAWAFPFTG
jgi:hypothetical protein